jgi:hypothetical protein
VTLSAFKRSLASKEPPLGLSPALAALWRAGKLASLRQAGAMANFDRYLLIFLALKAVPRGASLGTAHPPSTAQMVADVHAYTLL